MFDFRSDTVTKPTPAMREAMAKAEVGDDVFGEDPTVNRLQEVVAWKLRKEAGLFFPSGTMANQVAIKCWTEAGDEILLERRSHILNYELAAFAVVSGVMPRPVEGERGIIRVAALGREFRPKSYLFSAPSLICLEDTTNMTGGTCYPLTVLKENRAFATETGIPIHLDGARLFNAAVAQKVEPFEITQYADSVMVCLSKGLAAPVGSVLCGPADFIEKARKWRKLLGGGMRQVGVLAAAGLVAVQTMVDRLAEDHELAKTLAAGLQGTRFRCEVPETNIVIIDVRETGKGSDAIAGLLEKAGIRCVLADASRVRLVTHCDVGKEAVAAAIEAFRNLKV
ncbi:MAG: aminotransferase class I/II-fold pyridoxal phosphate-dependent enzyme [Planctomycetes bacterium]|nr:aminotransferase class I/II-fold pyridoxal phosphate-dependent enzyme [Planctomycetota bacterium]